jgi:hypothetical protein
MTRSLARETYVVLMTVAKGSVHRSASVAGIGRALAVTLVGAALVGGLSSFGQTYLPAWVNSLCNSAGGWSMFTFLLVWASRAKPVFGAILGVAAFEIMLESYAAVSAWRGFFYANPLSNTFTLPGIFAGIILGVGAALVAQNTGRLVVLGVVPLTAVLVLEGIYGLTLLSSSTSPVYWTIEIVLGAAFLVLAVRSMRSAR